MTPLISADHARPLMSGVMTKVAVYGFIRSSSTSAAHRLVVEHRHHPACRITRARVLSALMQHDLKRLLATTPWKYRIILHRPWSRPSLLGA